MGNDPAPGKRKGQNTEKQNWRHTVTPTETFELVEIWGDHGFEKLIFTGCIDSLYLLSIALC